MATRMQQRRGTDSQWTTANPVLGPGEIGFDTTNNRFKIGDGVNTWADLNYFVDETSISGSLSDYVEVSLLGEPNGVATLDGSGKVPSAQLPDIGELSQDAVNQALTAGTGVTKTYDDAANTLTLEVDTTVIATKTYVDDEIAAIPAPDYTGLATETYVDNGLATKADSVHTHAIADVTNLQTSLDSKAALAGATFIGDVTVETDLIVDGNLTVSGTTTTVSAQDLVVSDPLIYMGEGNNANLVDLGIVASYDDGTYQHTGIVRDSSAGKWKLFKGVTDEPTTTVNFAQGSLDDLAVGALEATSATIGDVSNTELQYLNGVTSAIQTQLDGKAATSHTHAIADVTDLATTLSGKQDVVSGVSSTEIGYLDGVTSAIQTQLNGKAPTNSPTFTGTVTLPTNTSIGDVSSTELGYLANVTSDIQSQINALGGRIVQQVSIVIPDSYTTSSTNNVVGTLNITPSKTSSKIMLIFDSGYWGTTFGNRLSPSYGAGSMSRITLRRGTTDLKYHFHDFNMLDANYAQNYKLSTSRGASFVYFDSPNSTSEVSYNIRWLTGANQENVLNQSSLTALEII